MHSPAEIGHEDRIAQGIRLEPAVSLVSLDLDRQAIEGRGANFSRPVLGEIHHEYSQNPIPARTFASNSLDSWGGYRVRNHVKIAFWVAMDRSLSHRSDIASSIRSAIRSTSAGADRHRRKVKMGNIRKFIHRNYRHFNAGALMEAAVAYEEHLRHGGQMLVTLAGAMSTAELGVSLAEMIREGKVHAISCTGANLEEDLFNLVAHDDYVRVSDYRELSAEDEEELMVRHLYRVTDTCIPEDVAVLPLEKALLDEWRRAQEQGRTPFPARVPLPDPA